MSKKLRLSKADYFRSRLQNAIDNKLIEKANYFENRLIAMNEPTYKTEGMEVHNKKLGKLTRHDIIFKTNTMRIYSV
jgi:hypothetical protein